MRRGRIVQLGDDQPFVRGIASLQHGDPTLAVVDLGIVGATFRDDDRSGLARDEQRRARIDALGDGEAGRRVIRSARTFQSMRSGFFRANPAPVQASVPPRNQDTFL